MGRTAQIDHAGGLTLPKSVVIQTMLFGMWLTIASGAVVFSEPAPFDILMAGLMIGLTGLGLTRLSNSTLLLATAWLLVAVGGLVAAMASKTLVDSTKHTIITFYLSLASVVIAAFIAQNRERHLRLIISAYVISALIAAIAGTAGYFGLVPGAKELFVLFERARGTFKDPNVFGAYLVPAALLTTQIWLNRPIRKAFWSFVATPILVLGVLVSFSRGAWASMIFGFVILGYLNLVTVQSNRHRLKLFLLATFGIIGATTIALAALQVPEVSALFSERASLMQSYDVGPQGRFGGQQKALGLISEHPMGIGALVFGRHYHGEDVHNVYLSMFLNAGWLGGLVYLWIVGSTIVLGMVHVFKRDKLQQTFIAIYASFIVLAIEGLIVDTDHWRHFFVLLGMAWGVMITREIRSRNCQLQLPRPRPLLSLPSPAHRLAPVPALHSGAL